MALLHEILTQLLDKEVEIGPILLRIKFLAARLGNHTLADWVKHETEGYPDNVAVPDYRVVGITYEGNFTNGVTVITGTPVSGAVIRKHANDSWLNYSLRESISVVESYVERKSDGTGGGRYSIGTGNLLGRISGKVFQGYTCTHLDGFFSAGVFVGIVTIVRSRLLDLMLELEAKVPGAGDIEIGPSKIEVTDHQAVQNIVQYTIMGNMTAIHNSGAGASVDVKVVQGDALSLKNGLMAVGLSEVEASELAEIAAGEKPEDKKTPFGRKALDWIAKRTEAGIDGVLKIGGSAAKDEISDLFQRFYDWMM